jgi:tetratricopeptide (TPR) repeat protein
MNFLKKETEGEKYKRLFLNYRKHREEICRIESKWSNRNSKGIELEKECQVDKAIELYEKNIEEESDGTHPYTRLAIIYRKKGLLKDEIRVLEKAKNILKNHANIDYFNKRLEKATKVYCKKNAKEGGLESEK